MTIVLTGTTGHLGSLVLHHLLALIPPSEIVVAVHSEKDDAKKGELESKGVTVRTGVDYDRPETMEAAFRGSEKLFLLSAPTHQVDIRVSRHRNAIHAAKAAGIKHIYYTSLAFAPTTTARVMQAHIQTEAMLKSSGMTYTIIREGLYAESYALYLGFFTPKDNEVVVPGDGAISWIAWDDLALGNAKVIASGEYINQTILLSGPKAYTLRETTALVSSILGRKIDFVLVSGEDWLQRHAKKGDLSGGWVSTYPALEKGDAAAIDPLLEKLIGRPLVPFEDRLKALLSESR